MIVDSWIFMLKIWLAENLIAWNIDQLIHYSIYLSIDWLINLDCQVSEYPGSTDGDSAQGNI